MATPTESLSNKLKKCDESFTVHMYDNGYMVEVGGRDHDDEWATAKVLCSSVAEIQDIVDFIINKLPRS